jgi:hypothetical protein
VVVGDEDGDGRARGTDDRVDERLRLLEPHAPIAA